MKKVLVIFGTRPEAIKMAPIIKELERHAKAIDFAVCVTAQHRDMLDQVLSLHKIKPEYDLNIMSSKQSLYTITEKIISGMQRVLEDYRPDWVLVHGDTTTSFAAALASFYYGAKIGHVEAGLRTNDITSPYPEEANRQLTARLADLHFAPTELCRSNLIKEGISSKKIIVTGNTIIDTLVDTIEKLKNNNKYMSMLRQIHPILATNFRIILITAHRRENFGAPLQSIFQAIRECAQKLVDTHFIYPVHPNPEIQAAAYEFLGNIDNVHLIKPLDYPQMVALMKRSALILTDSGGIQEEAPTFGRKILVLRDVTERQEGMISGAIELVGANKELIIEKVTQLIETPHIITHNPFGDGKTSQRIIMEIIKYGQ